MTDEVADVLPTSQHTDVDEMIDRVATETTSGELSPEFRARVMARIEMRRSPYMTWTLAAATAAAAIVALVIVHPRQREPTPSPATVAATNAAIEPVVPSPQPTSPVATRVVESRTKVVVDTPVFAPAVPALPPINPIEPITRDSIQPMKLSIPQLTLEPIVMPAVDDDGSIRERQ